MNTGVVARRYAKALLMYVQHTGRGEQVCTQVRILLNDPAAAPDPLEPDLVRFLELLSGKGRMELVKPVFRSFVSMYLESVGIRLAHLTLVRPAPGIEQRLKDMLEHQLDCKVLLDTRIDESLIGGFVLEIDDRMLDASVRSQIEKIRRQFIISTNRLV